MQRKSFLRYAFVCISILLAGMTTKAEHFLIPGAASHDSKTSQYVRGWWPAHGANDNDAANACYDMVAVDTHLWILAYENGTPYVLIINDGGIDKIEDVEKHVKYSLIGKADLTGIKGNLKHLANLNNVVYGMSMDGNMAYIYRWDSETSVPTEILSEEFDGEDVVKDMGTNPENKNIYLLTDNGTSTQVHVLTQPVDHLFKMNQVIDLPYLNITDPFACIDPQKDGSFWVTTNAIYGNHYSPEGKLIDQLSSTDMGAPNGTGQCHFEYLDRKLSLNVNYCNNINDFNDHTESWNTPMIMLIDYTEGTDFTNGEGLGKQSNTIGRVPDQYSVHSQSNIRATACSYVINGRSLTIYGLDCDGGLYRIKYTMPDINLKVNISTGYNGTNDDITHFVATVSFDSLTDEQLNEINDNDVKDFNCYLIYIRDKEGNIIAEHFIDPDVEYDEHDNVILVFQPSYTIEIERDYNYEYVIGHDIEAQVLFGLYSPRDMYEVPIGDKTAHHDYPTDLGQPIVKYYIGQGLNKGTWRVDIDFDAADDGGTSREPVSYYVIEQSSDGNNWQPIQNLYYTVGSSMIAADTDAHIPGTYNFDNKGFAFGHRDNPSQSKVVATYISSVDPKNKKYRVRAVYASTNALITAETDKTASPVGNGTSAVDDIIGGNNQVNVYPTITNSNITLSSEVILSGEILVYDICGNICVREPANEQNEQTIDLSHISSGMYLVKVNNETHRIIKR